MPIYSLLHPLYPPTTHIATHFPFLSNKYSPPNVFSFLSFSLQWPIGGKEAKFIFNAFSLHTTVNFKNPISRCFNKWIDEIYKNAWSKE